MTDDRPPADDAAGSDPGDDEVADANAGDDEVADANAGDDEVADANAGDDEVADANAGDVAAPAAGARPTGVRNRIRAVPASRLAKGITGGLVCLVTIAGIALATTLPRGGPWSPQQVAAAGTLASLGLVTVGLHGATTLLDATVAVGNVVGSERLVDHLPGAAVHGTQLALAAAPLVHVVGFVLAFDRSSSWWGVGLALVVGGAVAGGAMAGVMGVAHAVATARSGGATPGDASATE